MAIRLIALDIDGTLLDSHQELPEPNRLAIAAATERGIEVALVTGRRYDFAMLVARKLHSPVTMIASNGAIIRLPNGQTDLRRLLSTGTALKVLQITREWRDAAALIFDRPGSNQILLEHFAPDDSLRYWYYTRNQQYIELTESLEISLTEPPLQILFAGKVAPMRAVENVLRHAPIARDYALSVTIYENKDFTMIDVLDPTVSKGVALARRATERGIARHEILAIGDNHNDLEMLRFAGVPVVMGNGVPELKTFGWHQTASNDDAGVAAAIEHFVLREAASCA